LTEKGLDSSNVKKAEARRAKSSAEMLSERRVAAHTPRQIFNRKTNQGTPLERGKRGSGGNKQRKKKSRNCTPRLSKKEERLCKLRPGKLSCEEGCKKMDSSRAQLPESWKKKEEKRKTRGTCLGHLKEEGEGTTGIAQSPAKRPLHRGESSLMKLKR